MIEKEHTKEPYYVDTSKGNQITFEARNMQMGRRHWYVDHIKGNKECRPGQRKSDTLTGASQPVTKVIPIIGFFSVLEDKFSINIACNLYVCPYLL